jgi:hypothetical protein
LRSPGPGRRTEGSVCAGSSQAGRRSRHPRTAVLAGALWKTYLWASSGARCVLIGAPKASRAKSPCRSHRGRAATRVAGVLTQVICPTGRRLTDCHAAALASAVSLAKIPRAKNRTFAMRCNVDSTRQALGVKIFCFRFSETHDCVSPSRAHEEGRTRRHERGARDAMDVAVSRDERCRYGRRSRVVLASRR